ncbi:RuvC family protein [Rhizobium rhizophilum]|uniref:hypothetical protein n=1 Tax=Rhizobium rhizophilum TaxID=1850373 RepID=UPI00197FE54F|nr:hypothetical protein [Rhizobium rhizophilum]
MTDEQIKHMVDRFLGWKLPDDFSPDARISFKADFNELTDFQMKHEPVGTNLLSAAQAEAMVRHLLAGLPPSQHVAGEPHPDDLAVDRLAAAMKAKHFAGVQARNHKARCICHGDVIFSITRRFLALPVAVPSLYR